jgi:hypothetical protein
MKKTGAEMRALVLGLSLLAIPSIARADAITVNVLNEWHAASVLTVQGLGMPQTTTTRTTNVPTSASLDIPASAGRGSLGTWATAAADLFGVDASTGAFTDIGAHSQAEAITGLIFQPLTTDMADLTLTAFEGQRAMSFSNVTARLTNLTSGAVLWSYIWDSYNQTPDQPGDVTIPWDRSHEIDQTAVVPLLTPFVAGSLYQLTLSAWTDAQIDREIVHLDLKGIHPVPEPVSVLLLSTAGAIGWWGHRRRR